jgi:hypothetical protein
LFYEQLSLLNHVKKNASILRGRAFYNVITSNRTI